MGAELKEYHMSLNRLRASIAAGLATTALGLAAAVPAGAVSANPRGDHAATTLRLGYLPNLTHAADLIGIAGNYFQAALPQGVTLSTTAFNAGPDVVTALFGGQLDAGYFGPSPALTAFTASNGAYQIVAGAASGGAAFVVQPEIVKAADLKGKTVSSPQLGNTQDVSLRVWLKAKGLRTTTVGTGDVTISPQSNSNIVTAFQAKAIAGAWVPEPYVQQLLAAGGHVLVDEATLWPKHQFATTVLVVSKAYLKANPAIITGLLKGEIAAINHLNANKPNAEAEITTAIKNATGKTISPSILHPALANVTLTYDPIASSITTDAKNAYALNFLTTKSVKGLYDLTLLNKVLKAAKLKPVATS
jgi:NitT/TauT family transport system substrate-binding protein